MSDKKTDKPKLSAIPNVTKDKARADLEAMSRALPYLIESCVIVAKIRKAAFDAHRAEGFTDSQSLELCKSVLL